MRRIVIGQPVVEWVAKRTGEYGNYGAAVGIGVERDGQIIGACVYNEWNGVNINIHCAAVEGSRWLSREALRVFFDYPFNQAGVNRITALVGEGNVKSQLLVEGVGFVLETTLRKADPTGDMLVYSMWRNDCRWIRRVENEQLKAA